MIVFHILRKGFSAEAIFIVSDNSDTLITEDCIPVEQLKKVRNDALKYATNKLES